MSVFQAHVDFWDYAHHVCACLQGFSQAKLAWKKKNAIPQTTKEVKAQRPDGRGDMGGRGGRGQAPNRGGGRAPVGEPSLHV